MSVAGRRRCLFYASAVLAAPLVGLAQLPARVRRIGYLHLAPADSGVAQWGKQTLSEALRRVGYEEGKNLVIEWRWADGKPDRLTALAEDLVRRKVELIVAWVNAEILAAKNATRAIPIVMLFGAAPVEAGLVTSLARPGGNITGTAYHGPETAGKILQILKEAKPSAVRIALLWNPSFPGMRVYGAEIDRVSRSLGMTVERFDATRPEDVSAALERIGGRQPEAFYFAYDPVLGTRIDEIAAFARARKLVSIGTAPAWVEPGDGLLSYAPDLIDIVARAAAYVDRILRGAKPADLPVELPKKYELVINRKTAQAIGYEIPPALRLRIDRVVE